MSVQLSSLTSDANSGDVDAQLQLADLYENGFGVPLDQGQAAYWYLNSAKLGHAGARYNLAFMYSKGYWCAR